MTKSVDHLRKEAVAQLDNLPGNYAEDSDGRHVFFDAVYDQAGEDESSVPWADLKPKARLVDYLKANPGAGRSAVDVACGLGDNAEALAAHGYQVNAFDIVEKAVDWAKKRFPETPVTYETGDLFRPNETWTGGFDLVHECYTIQALPENMVRDTVKAVCDLVAPGGTLLLYTRCREDGAEAGGPPWPLEEKSLALPGDFGLEKISDERFIIERHGRDVPHSFAIWKRP